GAREAHEVGCDEGELPIRLARGGLKVRGGDVSPDVISEARRRAAAAGCEVMEHLGDPEAALETVASLARPWAIVSVPKEPLWRCRNLARLKYVGSLGNTPGHLHHWSRRGLARFLERRLEVVELHSPPPWTMALCRADRA